MIVSVKNLMKRYEDFLAVDHLSFEVEQGEIYGILGPIGSGKTTLLECMLAIREHDKGKIELFGEPVIKLKSSMKKRIGVCFQEEAFFETLSINDNLLYFSSLYHEDKIRTKQAVEWVLSYMDLEKKKRFVAEKLNVSERKLLDISCAIIHKPELIMIDGGIGDIDPKIKQMIYQKLKELKESGHTILYFTHSIEETEEICDKVAIMDKGRILISGTKVELKKSISLGEKTKIRVYYLSEEQIEELQRLPGVYSLEYKDEILRIKSKKGKNNLIHILTYLQENNIVFGEIISELPTLKDVFWEMTGKSFLVKEET